MELVFTDREGPEERWLAAGGDAEALVAAPVTPVTEELIARMPHLKLIHSDGVGYDRIDLAAARERGCLSVSLHATDMGRPLYRRYGFAAEEEMVLDLRPGEQTDTEKKERI